MTFKNVTFLSDFGLADGSVGTVHSVVKALAPHVDIVDLSHDVTPYAIAEAGLALARAVPYLRPGVVFAAVDPANSRGVVVEVGGGQSFLVAPDNGVLAGAVALVGGATAAYEITSSLDSEVPSASFSKSRDLLAPIVAQLCNGIAPGELATAIDTATLVPGIMDVAETDEAGRIQGQVLWCDRFGNLHLNVEPDQIAELTEAAVEAGEIVHKIPVVANMAELSKGNLAIMPNSYGLLSIVSRGESAANKLGVEPDATICLFPVWLMSESSKQQIKARSVNVELKL